MNIRDIIKQIVKDQFVEIYGVPCTVSSIDTVANTCVCSPVNGDTDFIDVRLQAASGNGVLIMPKKGSVVMVQPINNVTGFIAMFSSVDSMQFLDGTFGGIVKADTLKTELDKTNQVVQAIQNALTTWTPVANDGGAALKTAAAAALTGKAVGNYGSIKNDKITHGNV